MNCVKDVNALRLKNPALVSENLRFVHEDPENTALGWVRWSDEGGAGNVYLCVAYLGDNDIRKHKTYILKSHLKTNKNLTYQLVTDVFFSAKSDKDIMR